MLSDTELRAAWLAAGNMPYPYGPLFRLLMLLGQRRTEVTEMRWGEVDLAAKTWTIPAERMKAGAAHVVPLPDDAAPWRAPPRNGRAAAPASRPCRHSGTIGYRSSSRCGAFLRRTQSAFPAL